MNRPVLIAITMLAGLIFGMPLLPSASAEDELGYGKSVSVTNNKITINRDFLGKLAQRPSLQNADLHTWEIVYLVNIGDRQAIGVAIDLVALDSPEAARVDDHHRTRELARALSLHEEVFWNLLEKKSLETRSKVVRFFDVNKEDYVGHDYDEEKKRILGTQKAR